MNLDTDGQPDPYHALTRQDLEEEYSRLLTYFKVDRLRADAQRWDLRLRETRKTSIVQQLAAWLSDPAFIRARIGELDDLAIRVLVHIHLILAQDYGMAADDIVRSVARQPERAQQQSVETDLLPLDAPLAGRPQNESSAAIQERVATLTRQGLLLPFRQNGIDYYVLPAAVRPYLPSRLDLFPEHSQAEALAIREITPGQQIQTLYAVWMAIAGGVPGSGQPLSRQALPTRHPIEDTWVALQDWNNDPDEIVDIAAGRMNRGRSGFPRLDRFSSSTLNWTLTIAPPPRRLSDADLDVVRQQTGRPAAEIEFCYVLLEALGALSADLGQPISIHQDSMYRILRAPAVDKVRTLLRAWATHVTWSEMENVLRASSADLPGAAPLRVRRSMAYPDFKPDNLYAEWRYARRTVLRFLSLLDEERWTSVEGFLRAIYAIHPNLLHTQTDSSIWRLESSKTGKQFGATFEDWLQGHGQFVLAMLQGPLYWLGMIRLGYNPSTLTPEAFQLSPAGAFALGKRAVLSPSEVVHGRASGSERTAAGQDAGDSTCSVSDDLTITLLPGHAPAELYDLVHTVGSLLEAAPDRFVYRLNSSRVLSWAQAAAGRDGASIGIDEAIESLIASLSKHCAPPGAPPQVAANWQRKLRTWGRNYGQLHVYENLTLIELADEYVLQELLVSTSLREYLVYQFSPHLVAIRDDAVDQLVQEMERRGYTPRVK